ncbi:MAG: hypothetical protein B6245_17530 [Desulfobacteraceae bacterium 4572_88]|nr:MAG: hypothetical protein B6245_17530 [Desulfobacteraceae bacterium 4572_88]
MNTDKADILIIGGGVIGLCTAYYTAARGASVILIERNQIPSPTGSSYGNAGLVVPSHCKPLPTPGIIAEGIRQLFDPSGAFSIRLSPTPETLRWLWGFYRSCDEKHFSYAVDIFRELSQESLRLHNALARDAGTQYEYKQTGLLHVCLTEKAFQEGREEAELMEKYGIVSRVLSGPEVRDMEPAITPRVVGGIRNPPDGRLHPPEFLNWLAQEAQNRGAQFFTETEVFDFGQHRGQVHTVHTTKGEFQGEQVVLASGVWTGELAKKLGMRMPIQGAKGYSLTFRRPENCPRIPLSLEDFYVAVTPYKETLRMTGFLELSGMDQNIELRCLRNIQEHTRVCLPELGKLELLEIWRGHRPCTPDGLPVLGRSGKFTNLWIASGHATKGMSLGPVTGRLMRDLLAGKSIGRLGHALRPDRQM